MRLVTIPDPVLHQPGGEVLDFEAAKKQAQAMIEFAASLTEPRAVGLASHQVGIPARMFVWRSHGDSTVWNAAANPELEWVGSDVTREEEGCLSIPDRWRPKVRRARVVMRFYDLLEGCERELGATDFHARVLQHEYEHTLGRLYTDRRPKPVPTHPARPRAKSKKRRNR